MNKNQKNSLILVIVIVVVFVVAYFAYNVLSQNAPNTSYTPTLNTQEIANNDNETVVATSQESSDVENAVSVPATTSIQDDVTSSNDDASTSQDNSEAEVSTVMPDIPLQLMNGEETTFWQLAELGKPIVINYFASWCPPCQSEMPHFIEASEEYKGEVTFIFFDAFDGERETMDALNSFAAEHFNDDTIVVIDPGYISYLFNTNSLPTTILLNRNGEPINGYQGMISKDTLTTAIDALL